MNQYLLNIKESIYDQESKENIERLTNYTKSTKRKTLERVSYLLDATISYLNRKLYNPPCDGTIVCPSSHHLTKCYSHSATDKQWRREMGKILNHAK